MKPENQHFINFFFFFFEGVIQDLVNKIQWAKETTGPKLFPLWQWHQEMQRQQYQEHSRKTRPSPGGTSLILAPPALSSRACEGRGIWKDSVHLALDLGPPGWYWHREQRGASSNYRQVPWLVGTTFEVHVPEAVWVFSLTPEPQEWALGW